MRRRNARRGRRRRARASASACVAAPRARTRRAASIRRVASASMSIVERHWLRWHSSASTFVDDSVDRARRGSGSSASNSSSASGRWCGPPSPGEEVRVARGDDAVDGQPARVTVVGVQAVPLPRVVTEHDVGSDSRMRRADQRPLVRPALELTVDETDEVHRRAAPRRRRGRACLVLAARDRARRGRRSRPRCPSSRR